MTVTNNDVKLLKQLATAANSGQLQFPVVYAVDQYQIGFDMAVLETEPVANQSMNYMTSVQHFVPLQRANHMAHGNNIGDGQFGDFFAVLLELAGVLKAIHRSSCRRSTHALTDSAP